MDILLRGYQHFLTSCYALCDIAALSKSKTFDIHRISENQ